MRYKSEKGQAMVEFALILPILILLLCGIIDFGWLYSNKISATNAAREAARYSAIHIYDESTNNDQLDAYNVVVDSNSEYSNWLDTVVLETVDVDGDGVIDSVNIIVTADVPLLTGVTSTILGKSSITITASSIMKIEN